MITRTERVEFTVSCDREGCATQPIVTPTDAGLNKILTAQGWWIGDEGVFCPVCTVMLQAGGKLGPRHQ